MAGKSFGSTKSGIAPFYSDKYAKIGFQVSELFDEEFLKDKVDSVLRAEECHSGASVSQTGSEGGGYLRRASWTYRDMVAPYRMRHIHLSVERTERRQEDPA